MSKRHQSSRRKSYGRRQHELRERTDRREGPDLTSADWDDGADARAADGLTFLDGSARRLRFALGD